MKLKTNSEYFEKDKHIWLELVAKLNEKLNKEIKIIFPNNFNKEYYRWFQEIEKNSFREELRYSFSEIEERFVYNRSLLLYLLADDNPEALLLGYPLKKRKQPTFYLDTIAVRHQSKGIGRILLKSFIKWARKEGYKIIALDTEEKDEKDILLKKFYESLGFKVMRKNNKDNLTMLIFL